MTVPGDATTGERQYRVVWTESRRGKTVTRSNLIGQVPAAEALAQAIGVSWVTDAWVEVAEWRRLDSPEPSDAERVESAHQRIHRRPGVIGLRGSDCIGRACPWLSIAYAALDVDDPAIEGEMPWRVNRA